MLREIGTLKNSGSGASIEAGGAQGAHGSENEGSMLGGEDQAMLEEFLEAEAQQALEMERAMELYIHHGEEVEDLPMEES